MKSRNLSSHKLTQPPPLYRQETQELGSKTVTNSTKRYLLLQESLDLLIKCWLWNMKIEPKQSKHPPAPK